MSVRINLPDAGLLGIAGARAFRISATPAQALVAGNIYVLEGDAGVSNNYTVTLPTTVNDGQQILLKKTGDVPQVQVTSALIEGTMQTIEITNSQPIRLIFVDNTDFGWLIA